MHPMRSERQAPRPCAGFTLLELIVALTLLGIVAVAVTPMLRLPVTAYQDAALRTDLRAELDAATAKLGSDLAVAMPNSVRVRQVGARWYLEYLELRAQGRYRAGITPAAQSCPATCSGAGANDVLELACNDSCFTTLGPLQGGAPVGGADYVVVNPLGPGVTGGDPYAGGAATPAGSVRTRLLTATAVPGGVRITTTAYAFLAASPSRTVYIVAQPVSYVCDPATQRLTRHWGYPIQAAQPAAFGAGTASAPLATRVTDCRFSYTATGGVGRGGVAGVWLRFTRQSRGSGFEESVEAWSEFSVKERS